MIHIDEEIVKKAAKIRAEYKVFKAMDALQLATACVKQCNLLFEKSVKSKNPRGLTSWILL